MEAFEITIKVTSLEQLQALWMIANSNTTTEDFLNENWQKERYGFEGNFNNPIGKEFWALDKELKKYHTSENF